MSENELADEMARAAEIVSKFTRFYHARECECPDEFKFILLVNGWHSPFVALNELVKIIEKDEMLLKKNGFACKKVGREMRKLVHNAEVWRDE